MRKVKYIWILSYLLIFLSSVESQIIDYEMLSKHDNIITFADKPFSGICKAYDKDSILILSKYTNGRLNGDSAYSRYYKNGLCKSTAKYDNGSLIDFKEFEYYGIMPMISGKNGGYVDRLWIVEQNILDVGLIKLIGERLEKTPLDLIVDKPDYDISNYKILSFKFSSCCRPGPDIEYSCKSNQLTDFIIKTFKDLPNDYYYFSDILCQLDNDTIRLPDMKFSLK